jgi:alpha-galactosidase
MNTTKIVFLGAGSVSFGMAMFRDLFSTKELQGSTLCLVDINPAALDRMARLACLLNQKSGAGMTIESTTDRRAAFQGAGFVVSSIAIDRNRLWKLDFEVPKKYGIHHTLGENGGPGGLFFTLRTIPLVLDIVRDMEEICPQAYFINFSNPESRIILALGRYSAIRCIGLCHGVFMARDDVARVTGLDHQNIDVWAAGLNHFQWLLEIKDRSTGEDLYPLLRQREREYDPEFMPVTRRLFRAFGYWPSCSDDHLGEYIAYGWEGGEEGYNFEGDERYREELQAWVEGVLSGSEQVPDDYFSPSGERGVAVITGILQNKKTLIESGVIYNRGAIPNLPSDLAVEVPVVVDAGGIHPVSLGPLPDPIAKLLTMQVGVQQLSVDAAYQGSRELALQALLIDPVINSSVAAEKILAELWPYNEPYIRKCA